MYIHSFCSSSPAGFITENSSSDSLKLITAAQSACIEPDYKDLIPVMQLRRMTKPVRTGVATARLCLQQSPKATPDAIHVGTAYGMLQDSENFLQKIIDQKEQMLAPTAFIQSTHNTVAGQIALSLGCYAHNMTYVHKAHSFESAVLDAALMLHDDKEKMLLVGAVDECTDTSYEILKRFGIYNEQVFAGEGANFFTISGNESTNSLAKIEAFHMFTAKQHEEINENIKAFLKNNNLAIESQDLVLSGLSELKQLSYFQDSEIINYKDYCGDFPTASSFALALAILKFKETISHRCWIINKFGNHFSIWFLQKNEPA